MDDHPIHYSAETCLNQTTRADTCTRCQNLCPESSIDLEKQPYIDTDSCTECTACAAICPTDAIRHPELSPVEIIKKTRACIRQGNTHIYAGCSRTTTNDVQIFCHAGWDALLFASLAAEGVHTLFLTGTDQCAECAVRHGSHFLKQAEEDYAILNQSLGTKLNIQHTASPEKPSDLTDEIAAPERRQFFQKLFPSMLQNVAMITTQLEDSMRQDTSSDHTPDDTHLPIRLRLFLRALPRLKANFTPVPQMPSLPLGAIQVNKDCTACGDCISSCPTHALTLKAFGAHSVLEFKPDHCIGCEHCIRTCPEKAIESLPGISLPAIATRQSRPLIMVAVDT